MAFMDCITLNYTASKGVESGVFGSYGASQEIHEEYSMFHTDYEQISAERLAVLIERALEHMNRSKKEYGQKFEVTYLGYDSMGRPCEPSLFRLERVPNPDAEKPFIVYQYFKHYQGGFFRGSCEPVPMTKAEALAIVDGLTDVILSQIVSR